MRSYNAAELSRFHKFDKEFGHVIWCDLTAYILWNLSRIVGWETYLSGLTPTIPFDIVEIAVQVTTAEFTRQVAFSLLTETDTIG